MSRPADASWMILGRRPRAWGEALLGLAAAASVGWLIVRPGRSDDGPSREQVAAELNRPVALKPIRSLTLTTDQGRPVRAFEYAGPAPGGRDPVELETLFLRHWAAGHQIIRASGPDLSCNCHGWTFTGGRCWVQSEDVEAVLHDNGYKLVADAARPGDVVIYRDADGKLCHSGIVVGSSRGGLVVVESKWAWLGRFVHPAGDQPYATRWAYYRSERTGHDLRVGPPLPAAPIRQPPAGGTGTNTVLAMRPQ